MVVLNVEKIIFLERERERQNKSDGKQEHRCLPRGEQSTAVVFDLGEEESTAIT